MPDAFPVYHRQIEAARNVGLAMTRTQLEAFVRLLEEYAEELATRVLAGIATRWELHASAVAREILQQLTRDLALATRNGVVITADRVARIYAEATLSLIESTAPRIQVGALFPGLNASAANAVLSRPELAAAFRTIRGESVTAVDRIIQRAALRAPTSTQLAMELRLHILGADVFPDRVLLDRRRIGYDIVRQLGYDPTRENLMLVRGLAGRVAGKAQLIARTEPMNAEHEAHIQGAIDSPVVRAIEWRLSSRHPKKDVCDVLAEADWYGLGAGVYDPRVVPARPHPRDLCRQRDVLWDDPAQWGQVRAAVPAPRLEIVDVVQAYELPASQERMLARALGARKSRVGRWEAA